MKILIEESPESTINILSVSIRMLQCLGRLVSIWHIHQQGEIFEAVGTSRDFMANSFEISLIQTHERGSLRVAEAQQFISL